ncbi:MAG: hypothetical protein RIQ56_232 [Candidatus Parcubacteria bacterium]|jgi:hypothetical protein
MRNAVRVLYSLLFVVVFSFPSFVFALEKPTCVMSSPPGPVYPGTFTRLIWYAERADRAFISNGIGSAPVPSGYVDVHPSVTTLYTMTVANAAGSNTCGALITVQQNSSILFYTPIVYEPVVFTPITYTSVIGPVGDYYYYTPSGTVYYDEWYDYRYGTPTYNRKYDFWQDFTRGPSTGPSLFEVEYFSPRYYTEVETRVAPGGDGVTYTRDCRYDGCITVDVEPLPRYEPPPASTTFIDPSEFRIDPEMPLDPELTQPLDLRMPTDYELYVEKYGPPEIRIVDDPPEPLAPPTLIREGAGPVDSGIPWVIESQGEIFPGEPLLGS